LQKLLRLEEFVLTGWEVVPHIDYPTAKKVRMTELKHRCLFNVYGCRRNCDWAVGIKKVSLATHTLNQRLVYTPKSGRHVSALVLNSPNLAF